MAEEAVEEVTSDWKGFRDETLERRLLSSAAEGQSMTVFKILKTKLVDVNCMDENKSTPVMKAAKAGHFDIVQMLVESGCDVNIGNTLLVTPLHIAAMYRHIDVIKLLILAGAKYGLKNREGLTAMDYAPYRTEGWQVLHDASFGEMPEIEEVSDVPVIPDFSIEMATGQKKKKKGGKKGKKKGGKKSGKKKGKKKKK